MNTRFKILDWIAGGAFSTILRTLKEIKMTNDELLAAISAATAKADKIGSETRALLVKITDLLAQLASGDTTPEVSAAIEALQAQLDVVDGLVPDVA